MDIMAQTTKNNKTPQPTYPEKNEKKLDKALDAIKNKYGEDKIKEQAC